MLLSRQYIAIKNLFNWTKCGTYLNYRKQTVTLILKKDLHFIHYWILFLENILNPITIITAVALVIAAAIAVAVAGFFIKRSR